eukprot:1783440-Pleurochrysis_carterae.AAC.4
MIWRALRLPVAAIGCVAFVALGIAATSYHSQLITAAARAQQQVLTLQAMLQRSQEMPKRVGLGSSDLPECTCSDNLSYDRVRKEVRMALRQVADELSSDAQSFHDAAASDDGNDEDVSGTALAELVRVEMAEGLALEDAGWCQCPPPPDFNLLCRALVVPRTALRSAARVPSARVDARELLADELRARLASVSMCLFEEREAAAEANAQLVRTSASRSARAIS